MIDMSSHGGKAVDIGEDIYALDASYPIELGFKSRNDFIKTFGEGTEELLLKYLPFTSEPRQFTFNGSSEDRQQLVSILNKRLEGLKATINVSGSALKNIPLQRYYNNILKLIFEIERGGKKRNEMSVTCKGDIEHVKNIKEDRLFEIMLEMSWYLLHPDKVPKDIQCDWAKVVKQMDTLRLVDIVGEINRIKGTNASANGTPVKPLNYFKSINLYRLKNSKSLKNAAKNTVAMVTEKGDSTETMKQHLTSVLKLLEMKKYLKKAALNGPKNITVMEQEMIVNPLEDTAANSLVTQMPKNTVVNPLAAVGGADAIVSKTPNVNPTKVVRKALGAAMTPLFNYFKKMFDPIYSFLEKSIETTTIPRNILPDLLQLLQIASDISSNGIYRLTNVHPDVIAFVSTQLRHTVEHTVELQDVEKEKLFSKQISSLPQISLTSITTTYVNTKTLPPYIQFLAVDANIFIPQTVESFKEKSKIPSIDKLSGELYSATNEFFTPEHLYILCTDATEDIPINVFECSVKDGIVHELPTNYFTTSKNDLKDANVFLDKLVSLNGQYNSAELALSILLLFKDKMPK